MGDVTIPTESDHVTVGEAYIVLAEGRTRVTYDPPDTQAVLVSRDLLDLMIALLGGH